MSYQFSSSYLIWGSTPFFSRLFAMMSLVSLTGTLVYRLEMSNEAREKCGRIVVLSSLLISSLGLPMLNVWGSGDISLNFW